MYTLFIIDDEINVLKSLKNSVDWSKLQFKVIGTAMDGASALKSIKEKHPDAVMTDIVMPGMDGLELIRSIQEDNASVKFVVLSAYDEFKYAQKALNYGVKAYLLKPFDDDELFKIFYKIKSELDSGIIDDTSALRNECDAAEGENMIIKTKNIIRRNISGDISLNKVAAELYVNSSYLSYAFKKEMGLNFNEYVNYIRLERAKEMLRASKYRVKDIALKVGYDNYVYFCHIFKKCIGVTPLEYRAKSPVEEELS